MESEALGKFFDYRGRWKSQEVFRLNTAGVVQSYVFRPFKVIFDDGTSLKAESKAGAPLMHICLNPDEEPNPHEFIGGALEAFCRHDELYET